MNHNEMKDGFIEEEIMNIINIPEINDYFLIQYCISGMAHMQDSIEIQAFAGTVLTVYSERDIVVFNDGGMQRENIGDLFFTLHCLSSFINCTKMYC